MFDSVEMSRFSIVVDGMRPSSWMSSCTKFQALVKLGGEKVTQVVSLTNPEDGKPESRCWKIVGSVNAYGEFSKIQPIIYVMI